MLIKKKNKKIFSKYQLTFKTLDHGIDKLSVSSYKSRILPIFIFKIVVRRVTDFQD